MDIFVPIDIEGSLKKSAQEGKGKEWFVRGFASTPDLDLQGDIVRPSGLDIDYFVKSGWVNYEHKQDAKYAIGVPTSNCYVDMEKGLFVEAKLFRDNEFAQEIWKLASNIKKEGIERQLGFSIEGAIRKRDDNDTRVIDDLVIKNVAITKSPANPHATWEMFMKSINAGHEINPSAQTNGEALRVEHLSQAITNLSYTYTMGNLDEYDKVWNKTFEYLDNAGRNTREATTIALQLYKGLSRQDAEKFLDSFDK